MYALKNDIFLQVQDFWVYTSPLDEDGRIVDPCDGDSGGPLVLWRNGGWELVGVLKVVLSLLFMNQEFSFLQGEGYDCATNKVQGDGEWSNVANQHRWISNQISLGGSKGAPFYPAIQTNHYLVLTLLMHKP